MAIFGAGAAHDQVALKEIRPILDALWPPLRFLADLKTVWADLEPEEQREIEDSRPFRERFHERLAKGYLEELRRLTQQLGSAQYRGIRDELMLFLEHWEDQEPDKVKVFSAMIQHRLDEVAA